MEISTALRAYLSSDNSERAQADALLDEALKAGVEFPAHLLDIYSHQEEDRYPVAAQCIIFLKLWVKRHPSQIRVLRDGHSVSLYELARWTVSSLPSSIPSIADVLIWVYRPGTGDDSQIRALAITYREDPSWFPLCFELVCDLTELRIPTYPLLPELFAIAFSLGFEGFRIRFCDLYVRSTLHLSAGHEFLDQLSGMNADIVTWAGESAALPLADFSSLWISLGDIRPEYAPPFIDVAKRLVEGVSADMAGVLVLVLGQLAYVHMDFDLCLYLVESACAVAHQLDDFSWFLTVPQSRAVRLFPENARVLYDQTAALAQSPDCRLAERLELLSWIAGEFGAGLGDDLAPVIGLALDGLLVPDERVQEQAVRVVQILLESDDIALDADGLLGQLFAGVTMENQASVLVLVVLVSHWTAVNRPDRPDSRNWEIFCAHRERLLAEVTPFFLRVVADYLLPPQATVSDALAADLLGLVGETCGHYPYESAMVAASLFTKDPQQWAEAFDGGLEFLVRAAAEDGHACYFLGALVGRLKSAAAVCLRRCYPDLVAWTVDIRPGQRIFQRIPLLVVEPLIRHEPDPAALEGLRHCIVCSFLEDRPSDIALDDIQAIAGSLSFVDGNPLANYVATRMDLRDREQVAELASHLSIMRKLTRNFRRQGGELALLAEKWLGSFGRRLGELLECPDIGTKADGLAKGLFKWAHLLMDQNHPAVHRFVPLVHAKLSEAFEKWVNDSFTFFEILLQTPEFIPEPAELQIIAYWANLIQNAEGVPLNLRVACHDLTAALVRHSPEAVWEMADGLVQEWDADIGTRSSLAFALICLVAQVGCHGPFQDEQRLIDILARCPIDVTRKTLTHAAEALVAFVGRVADVFPGCAFHAVRVIARILVAYVWIPPRDDIPLVSPISEDLRRLLIETCKGFIAGSEERVAAFQAIWQDEPRKWAKLLCLFEWE
jgi:hypothetical protein